MAVDYDTILIEDGTVFEAVGIDSKEVTKMIEIISSMEKKRWDQHFIFTSKCFFRVFISLSSKCVLYYLLKQQADYDMEIKLIGGGFGKDVTGNVSIYTLVVVYCGSFMRTVNLHEW